MQFRVASRLAARRRQKNSELNRKLTKSEASLNLARQAGAHGALAKPVGNNELLNEIRAVGIC